MVYRPAEAASPASPPSVAELFAGAAHAGALVGASRMGAAADGERRVVELALWLSRAGQITRARFKATSCPALIACAERACQLLEAGVAPLDAARLVREVTGLHPHHHSRAALVVEALEAARASHP